MFSILNSIFFHFHIFLNKSTLISNLFRNLFLNYLKCIEINLLYQMRELLLFSESMIVKSVIKNPVDKVFRYPSARFTASP